MTLKGYIYELDKFEYLTAKNYTWKDESNGDVSAGAIFVDDDEEYFIGRVKIEGKYVPCRIFPDKKRAMYHYHKQVIMNEDYEVLTITGESKSI